MMIKRFCHLLQGSDWIFLLDQNLANNLSLPVNENHFPRKARPLTESYLKIQF